MEVFVGIDIGGSHMGIGFINTEGSLIIESDETINNKEITPKTLVALMADRINEKCLPGWTITGVGIGCPGQSKNGIIVATANFPHFHNSPIASMLSTRLGGVSVLLMNDGDAAIAAEIWGGETKSHYIGYRNVVMLTLGTGIGMGMILDQKLFQGSNGLVEGGHSMVAGVRSGRLCGCGQQGCVEMYASARSTVVRLRELDELSGCTEFAKNAKEVFERFHDGEENAIKVIEETAEYLALLCINVCRIVDPEIIIFGGGMAQAGATLIKLVQKNVNSMGWKVLPTDVRLSTAYSASNAGIIGAAVAAKYKFKVQSQKKNHNGVMTEINNNIRKIKVDENGRIYSAKKAEIDSILANTSSVADDDYNYKPSSRMFLFRSCGLAMTVSGIILAGTRFVIDRKIDKSVDPIETASLRKFSRNMQFANLILQGGITVALIFSSFKVKRNL